ncbi:hypothetical protein Tco_0735880 [Tanacetum coccineum]
MKDKMVYKGNNVVGALMNVPIFVGTFSVVTDFAVLENMDGYHDERMCDVIFGKPFLREVGIKTKRFEGIITIYNGDDKVTYQMVRSHLRFLDTAYSSLWIRRPRCKEIDEVGEVSIIWNPMFDCSHAGIQTHVQHEFLLNKPTWRIYQAKYQESFSF